MNGFQTFISLICSLNLKKCLKSDLNHNDTKTQESLAPTLFLWSLGSSCHFCNMQQFNDFSTCSQHVSPLLEDVFCEGGKLGLSCLWHQCCLAFVTAHTETAHSGKPIRSASKGQQHSRVQGLYPLKLHPLPWAPRGSVFQYSPHPQGSFQHTTWHMGDSGKSIQDTLRGELKRKEQGALERLSQLRIWLLISAHILISGVWVQVLCWALHPCGGWSEQKEWTSGLGLYFISILKLASWENAAMTKTSFH